MDVARWTFHHERCRYPLSPVVRYLLSVCFCPAEPHEPVDVELDLKVLQESVLPSEDGARR
jgi:hypothetical protein